VVLVMIVSFLLSGGLAAQVRKIQDLFSDIGIGDFSARAKVVSSDELGDMAVSLNAMLDNTLVLIQSREERDAIQDAIMRLLEEISGLTEGNLTARADVTEDVTGAIADSFNTMAEQLSRIVRNVKDATRRVGSISSEVSDSTRGLAETSQTQSEQVAGAITTINEMAESIRRVAENAVQSAAVSQRSTENAREGAAAVEKTNASMDEIRERVQETARAIKRLGESSQEIGNIVQIINDIADRTSILALNASIQAAMAGDAGRGFAVVAEEVQRLAERSTSSTKQIETLVKTIQGDINEAGSSMNESIQRVVEGTRLAGDAHDKLQEIETVSADLAELIQSISQAAREQTVTSENISKTMGEVGEVSDRTSEASRQTAQSMREMAETADHLRVSVEVFTLEEEGDAGAPGNPEAA
ncbi:MAG: HAMP domain-containing protein, partial [Desulfobacterales bacterium]|nr:HAMP domain-containing protein [Desulfobacterales bacterium]